MATHNFFSIILESQTHRQCNAQRHWHHKILAQLLHMIRATIPRPFVSECRNYYSPTHHVSEINPKEDQPHTQGFPKTTVHNTVQCSKFPPLFIFFCGTCLTQNTKIFTTDIYPRSNSKSKDCSKVQAHDQPVRGMAKSP